MSAAPDRSLEPPDIMPTVPEVADIQSASAHISLRDFFTYLGPTLIVSLAYIDPGNFGTDIAGGSQFNYALILSVWMASAFAKRCSSTCRVSSGLLPGTASRSYSGAR